MRKKVLRENEGRLLKMKLEKIVSSSDRVRECGRKLTELPVTAFITIDDFKLLYNYRKCL